MARRLVDIAVALNPRASGSNRRYHGRTRAQLRKVLERIYGQREIPERKETISCDGCGVKVRRYLSAVKNRKQFFCSRKCADVWIRRTYPTRFKVDVTCAFCGAVFKRIKSDVKPGNNYCSCSCSNRAQAARRQGVGEWKEAA